MTLGTVVKEFPPRRDNMRNSEGCFVRLPSGRIAYAYSRYYSNRGDDAPCDIAVVYSDDEGRSFSDENISLTAAGCGANNVMSVSLLPLSDGSIGVFYVKKYGLGTENGALVRVDGWSCRVYMRRTRDFVSYSDEVAVTGDDALYGVNNDRVRRLSGGEIAVPVAFGPKTTAYDKDSLGFRLYVSTDEGVTFAPRGEARMPYPIEKFPLGLQEPGVEQFADGRLYAFFRNQTGRQLESFSSDGGYTWTAPEPSIFTSPVSPMNMRRLSCGKIAAVYNPAPLYPGRGEMRRGVWTGGRTPLAITFVGDEMNSLGLVYEVEDDPERGYNYCAIFETEDAILLGYGCGGPDDGSPHCRHRITRLEKTIFKENI